MICLKQGYNRVERKRMGKKLKAGIAVLISNKTLLGKKPYY